MKELIEIRQIILLSEQRSKRHPHLKTVRDCVAMQWVSRFSSRKSPLAPLFQRGVVRRDSEELVTACKKFPLFERGIKGDFVGKKTAATILVFLWMVLPRWGLAAERKSDLRVTYNPPRISVEARGVKLREVLRDISSKVGFDLTDYGIPDKDITVSIEEATVEDLLRQLLRGENYGVVYREKDKAISKVLLLSSPAYVEAAPMSDSQQTRAEAGRSQEGLTVFSAAPSYQPARPERKGETRAESEPRVDDILRAHAMPGVTGSGTFPQSSTPNALQPPRNFTPGFSPIGAASPTRESLAMTTRLAQQNLKASSRRAGNCNPFFNQQSG